MGLPRCETSRGSKTLGAAGKIPGELNFHPEAAHDLVRNPERMEVVSLKRRQEQGALSLHPVAIGDPHGGQRPRKDFASPNTLKAVCVVEIQVYCDDVWTDDTTMAQIVKQARESAAGRVGAMFEECGADDADLRCKRRGARGMSFIGVKRIVTQVVSES